MIPQCTCSAAADSFLVLARQHRGQWDAALLPVHQRSLLLALLRFSLALSPVLLRPPPPLARSLFVAWGLFLFFALLLTMCALFLFLYLPPPPPPKRLSVSSTPPLCNLFFLLTSCCSSLATCIYLNTLPNPTAPLSAGSLLCCGGPQKRSGQMVSDDFRALLISTGNSLVLLLLLLLLA